MSINQDNKQMWIQKLALLKQEHRELDIAIKGLTNKLNTNQLEVTRLKKQKLKLKDSITYIENTLIPDLHA